MKKAITGFTLAETLITLGIIGIISALTMPTLVANYRQKIYVAQLQKVYNQIYNAGRQLMADEDVDNINDTYLNIGNPYDDEGFDEETQLPGIISDSAGKFLKKYFKVVKDCGFANATDCIGTDYKGLDGAEGKFFISGDYNCYCVGINTGATICMCPPDDGSPALFSVDINGVSGPNIMGRDAFIFSMYHNGDIAETMNVSRANDCGKDHNEYGVGCFDKIIEDGWKMDY